MSKNEVSVKVKHRHLFVFVILFIISLNSNISICKKFKSGAKSNKSLNRIQKNKMELKSKQVHKKSHNRKINNLSKKFRFKEKSNGKDEPIVTSMWSAHRNLLPLNAFKVMNDYSLKRSNDLNSAYGDNAKIIDSVMIPHNNDVVRKVIKDSSNSSLQQV